MARGRRIITVEERRQQYKEDTKPNFMNFPEDLGKNFMLMFFSKYKYNRRNNVSNSIPERSLNSAIGLPFPSNLQDNSSFNLASDFELGRSGAYAAEMIGPAKEVMSALASGDRGASRGALNRIFSGSTGDALKTAGWAALTDLVQEGLSKVSPGIQKGFEIGTGYSFNPHSALAFNSVNMKSHSFDWTLMPQTRKETEDLKKIVRMIQYHSHPSYKSLNNSSDKNNVASRAFFEYPDICEILLVGPPDEYYFKFKPCLIDSVSVNYNASGEPLFLEGGAPGAVKISISLKEMEIWTKDDYRDNSRSPFNESSVDV